jgi:hypothetical protein
MLSPDSFGEDKELCLLINGLELNVDAEWPAFWMDGI